MTDPLPPTPPAQRSDPDRDAFVVSAYETFHAELFAFLARSTMDRTQAEDLLLASFRRFADGAGGEPISAETRDRLYRIASTLAVAPKTARPRTQPPSPR